MHALLLVGVLHQREEDVRFRIVGIEPLVLGGIIVLQQNHGILPFDGLHVGIVLALAHGIDRIAVHRPPIGIATGIDGIYVDGNE